MQGNQREDLRRVEVKSAVSGDFAAPASNMRCILGGIRIRFFGATLPFLSCNRRKSRPKGRRRITAPDRRGEALSVSDDRRFKQRKPRGENSTQTLLAQRASFTSGAEQIEPE